MPESTDEEMEAAVAAAKAAFPAWSNTSVSVRSRIMFKLQVRLLLTTFCSLFLALSSSFSHWPLLYLSFLMCTSIFLHISHFYLAFYLTLTGFDPRAHRRDGGRDHRRAGQGKSDHV